jgi:hypothetical protein
MKKLLGIVVAGLLLVSCSEYSHKKKIEKIQKCADPKAYDKGANVGIKNGKNFMFFLPPKPLSYDPLGILKEREVEKLNNIPLKEKLDGFQGIYQEIWDDCERESSQTPVKFKEKYLKDK